MAQARPRSDPEISLFPFLSILVCLIGALVLLIVIMTIVQSSFAGGKNIDEVVRAREADKLKRELKEIDKKMTAALGGREDPRKLEARLKEKQERFVLLRKRLTTSAEDRKKDEQTNAELQKELENLIIQMDTMKKERPPLVAEIDKLKKEIAARKLNINAKPAVIVQPSGSGAGADAKLFFAVATGAGLTLYDGAEKKKITTGSIGTDEVYNAFLKKVAAEPKGMLLFLLRDDGTGTFNRAAGWAESKFNVRTGKLPLPGGGEPDLSRFQ
jgi:cell division protein FtsB